MSRAAARHALLLSLMVPGVEVRVQELCQLLDASPATVRRDLELLEREGHLIRTYGGAVLRDPNPLKPSYRERLHRNQLQKMAIARRAVQEIEDRETVLICGGTTTYYMAQELVNAKRELTVVTNALDIAMELTRTSRIRTVVLGGEISESYSIGGFLGEAMLSSISRVDRVFLGADGVDLHHGLTSYLPEDAAIIRKMMGIALEAVVLVDHTKFGQVKLAPLISLDDVDLLITDDGLDPETYQAYVAAGVRIERAPTQLPAGQRQ